MFTIFITPKARVSPLAMRNNSPAENRPFSVWVMR